MSGAANFVWWVGFAIIVACGMICVFAIFDILVNS